MNKRKPANGLPSNYIEFKNRDEQIDFDTRMANAHQMATLFRRDEKTIRKHINNAIKEELADSVVVANFAITTQHGAIEEKQQVHNVNFYNLDVVISVGYRVKSQRGVQFRQWANKILKDYLVKGYAVNERIRREQIEELRQLMRILGRTIENQEQLTKEKPNQAWLQLTDGEILKLG